MVRNRVREEKAAGGDWRPVIDGLRPHTARLWIGFTEEEKRRFSNHLRPFWDVHRHRMAGQVAERFEQAGRQGSVTVQRGRLASLEFEDGRCRVTFRSRDGDRTLHVRAVINCTGPASHLPSIRDPLCRALVTRRLVQPGPLGLGMVTDEQLSVLDFQGRSSARLFSLGPLLKGQLWETTAIPEIRVQAAQLAERLLS